MTNSSRLLFHPGVAALSLIALAGLLGVPGASHAAWEVLPSVSVDSTWQDNVRLRPDDKEDGFVHSGTLQATLSNFTEVSEVSAIVGGTVTRYTGVDTIAEKTRVTGFSQLVSRRRYERTTIGLNGSFRRDDLFRSLEIIDLADEPAPDPETGSLLPQPGVDDELLAEVDPDINSVDVQVIRNRLNVSPLVNFRLDQRTSVNLRYNFSQRTYDNAEGISGLQDSRSHGVNVGLQRQLSPLQSLFFRVGYSRLDPDDGIDSDLVTGTVGWTADLSEITRVAVSLGARWQENDLDSSWGSVGSVRIDRRLPNGRVFALVERSVMPSGFGELVESDRVELGLRGRFSQRVRWNISAEAFSTKNPIPGARGEDETQDYFRVRPRIRWMATETLSVSGAYAFTWVDRERFEGSASRNAVTLSLAYSPRSPF